MHFYIHVYIYICIHLYMYIDMHIIIYAFIFILVHFKKMHVYTYVYLLGVNNKSYIHSYVYTCTCICKSIRIYMYIYIFWELRNIKVHNTSRCNMLQHTATHCNTLQHGGGMHHDICMITIHHAATRCNMLQQAATHAIKGGSRTIAYAPTTPKTSGKKISVYPMPHRNSRCAQSKSTHSRSPPASEARNAKKKPIHICTEIYKFTTLVVHNIYVYIMEIHVNL